MCFRTFAHGKWPGRDFDEAQHGVIGQEPGIGPETGVAQFGQVGTRLGAQGCWHAGIVSHGLQRGPLSGAGIYRIVTKYGRLADIEGLTPHTLRHTFAKNLIDAGKPLTVVAELMGHESLDTLAIYARPSREDLERAISDHW